MVGQPGSGATNFGKYSTSLDDKVKVQPFNDELPPWVKESFLDSEYRTVITNQDITVYRVYGEMLTRKARSSLLIRQVVELMQNSMLHYCLNGKIRVNLKLKSLFRRALN